MATLPPFPTFDIEGRQFSRLILGHNPFLGGSYMSEARSRVYRETFAEAAAVERIIVRSIEMGVRGMVTSLAKDFTPRCLKALRGAAEKTGVLLPTIVIVTQDYAEQFSACRDLNAKVLLVHGQLTDALYVKSGNTMKGEFAAMLKRMREEGFVPAMSTHNAGETVPAAEPFDTAAINTPVNKIAWRMCPCEEMVLSAIRATKKKVIAMKPLAMGRIAAEEGMAYVCRMPDLDGIVVGIGHEYEAEETFGAARGYLGL